MKGSNASVRHSGDSLGIIRLDGSVRNAYVVATWFLALSLTLSVSAAGAADTVCRRAPGFADPAITSSFPIFSAVYGDFNEDGRPDAALMLDPDGRVIALNRGAVFQPMPLENVPGYRLVAASDVNHDGHLDLIYRGFSSVEVALGFGDGTFRPFLSSSLPRGNIGVWRIVDFNHDGLLDFVDLGPSGYAFVQSKGDGTFGEVAHVDLSFPGFSQEILMAAGDFDGDGNVDVVRIDPQLPGLGTLLTFGWNDGNFHLAETRETADFPALSFQPVDIDGDGAEELVTIDDGSLVIVHVKNRHMTIERFPVAPQGTRQVLNNPTMLDVNGDGIRDLVFSNGNTVGVVWGGAGNRFRDASYFELPGSTSFDTVDLDGDGAPDFAATNGSDGLPVLYGATLAAGRPNANRVYPMGFKPTTLALADVDGDGSRDLIAISDTYSDQILRAMVLFGDGHGAFSRAAKPFAMPAAYWGRGGFAGDFDGDGHADLAVFSSAAGTKPVVAFGSSAGFESPTLMIDADSLVGHVFIGSPSSQALLALRGDDVQLVTISSDRRVTASTIYHRPAGATILVVRSEPNAPAQFAVVTLTSASTDIRLVTRGTEGWHESMLIAFSYNNPMAGIASADLDGDGRADFIILGGDGRANLLFAKNDGSYRLQYLATVSSVDFVTPADFDGDGVPDLIVTARGNFGSPGIVQVLRNAGGSFQPYATSMSGAPFTNDVVVDDIDGDGQPDVIIPTFDGAEVLNSICVTPRIGVAAVPEHPTEGGHVTLLIQALTPGMGGGNITISEGGSVLGELSSYPPSLRSWISPPLTPGTHTFRIDYVDYYGGSSHTEIVVTTMAPRHRAARP